MAVARCISKVVTSALLMILFFVVLTPIALLARRCGKRFLDLAFREECDSYWVLRDSAAQRHDCEKQY
jgi:hypothetical protein